MRARVSNHVRLRFAGPKRHDSRNAMLQLSTWGSSSATALARAAFGADAAGAGTNDFVAAAHGTGDAHEDAAKRYCYSV